MKSYIIKENELQLLRDTIDGQENPTSQTLRDLFAFIKGRELHHITGVNSLDISKILKLFPPIVNDIDLLIKYIGAIEVRDIEMEVYWDKDKGVLKGNFKLSQASPYTHYEDKDQVVPIWYNIGGEFWEPFEGNFELGEIPVLGNETTIKHCK